MRNWTKIFKFSTYILSVLVLILYILSIHLLDGWMAVFILMTGGIILILSLVSLILLIVRIIVSRNHTISNYAPVLVFLVVSLIIYYNPIDRLIEQSKSPIVLYGYCEHTVTTVSLTFREDQTFEHNPGAFLTHDRGFGTYKIRKDSIFLNFDDESDAIAVNDTLVFDNEFMYELGNDTIHLHVFKITTNKIDRPEPNNKQTPYG